MVSIRKALASDFENIYPVILEVYKNTNIPKDNWNNLFKGYWCEHDDFFGYLLIENKIVIGFLGAVFSYRIINNELRKICNLSTWVVSEKYRSYSI